MFLLGFLARSGDARRWIYPGSQGQTDPLRPTALPVSLRKIVFRVALYLQHLIEQSQSPSVIDSSFYSIKWAKESMMWLGFPLQTNCVVEAVGSASNRILGTATVNRKEPISSHLIHKIVSHANLDNPVDFRNVTMYVFCFTGFFRFDDINF